jgi:hypothetical protein
VVVAWTAVTGPSGPTVGAVGSGSGAPVVAGRVVGLVGTGSGSGSWGGCEVVVGCSQMVWTAVTGPCVPMVGVVVSSCVASVEVSRWTVGSVVVAARVPSVGAAVASGWTASAVASCWAVVASGGAVSSEAPVVIGWAVGTVGSGSVGWSWGGCGMAVGWSWVVRTAVTGPSGPTARAVSVPPVVVCRWMVGSVSDGAVTSGSWVAWTVVTGSSGPTVGAVVWGSGAPVGAGPVGGLVGSGRGCGSWGGRGVGVGWAWAVWTAVMGPSGPTARAVSSMAVPPAVRSRWTAEIAEDAGVCSLTGWMAGAVAWEWVASRWIVGTLRDAVLGGGPGGAGAAVTGLTGPTVGAVASAAVASAMGSTGSPAVACWTVVTTGESCACGDRGVDPL